MLSGHDITNEQLLENSVEFPGSVFCLGAEYDSLRDYIKMLEYLDELYYKTRDNKEKEKIGTYHKNLSVYLEDFLRVKFSKNNKFYKSTVYKLKKTKDVVRKHLETQAKIEVMFRYLSQLLEQLDTLVFTQ